jgi:hypothetical protein
LQLALKHRKNKNGGQRVVVFNGSPIDASPEELKQLGTLMRRNNVRWPGLFACAGCISCRSNKGAASFLLKLYC